MVVLKELYGILGIETGAAAHKAGTLPAVQSLSHCCFSPLCLPFPDPSFP